VNENAKENSQTGFQICPTFGEILPDGSVVDLVIQGFFPGQLSLLHWDGKKYFIAPEVQVGTTTYVAPFLDPSVLCATRFPRDAEEYGTRDKLFWKVTSSFQQYLRFSEELAAYAALAVFATWFPDCHPSPLTVCVEGWDLRQAMRFFRLFGIFCRRPLAIAEFSRHLPINAYPTLLVVDLAMSKKGRSFWRATNDHNIFVPAGRGMVRNLACTKVIFSEAAASSREDWGREAMYFPLPLATNALPVLTETEEELLATEFQAQFLMYRLHHLLPVYQSMFAPTRPRLPGFELGRILLACVQDDSTIVKLVTPLLDAQEQDEEAQRLLNPEVVIVEVLWSVAHAEDEKEISTAEITERVNALLRSRGETSVYNPREIGWKLKNLRLERHDNGHNRVLRFSRETRRRIHQLAAGFGLILPKMAGCADCEGSQLIVQ